MLWIATIWIPNRKKFENIYFIIDSSDINSVFSIQLQNKWRTIWDEKQIFQFLVKKNCIFDPKSQFSEISLKLDCNPQIHRFTEKETITWKAGAKNQNEDRHAHTRAIYTFFLLWPNLRVLILRYICWKGGERGNNESFRQHLWISLLISNID